MARGNKNKVKKVSLATFLRDLDDSSSPSRNQESEIEELLASKGRAVLSMECRNCGSEGDHWSFKCPDLARQTETFEDMSSSTEEPPRCPVCHCEQPVDVVKRSTEDENSVRVSNLPTDTSESDIVDLFGPSGSLARVHLAMDEKTDSTTKFAIVEYVERKNAEKIIHFLNGFEYYDEAILQVEWAAPRPKATYVPPVVCESCTRDSESSIRVTNISERITVDVFLELFRRCGLFTVAYLAADEVAGSRTRFGIVEYERREGAENAIKMLNGFEFYNELRVEGPFRLEDLRKDLGE
ncbi:hypothetical protein EJB05_19718, partial [Eragrostis curvula]